jgi:hypothetical protein
MHMRNVEALLQRAEARTNPIGEHVVAHIGIRAPAREAVQDAGALAAA